MQERIIYIILLYMYTYAYLKLSNPLELNAHNPKWINMFIFKSTVLR